MYLFVYGTLKPRVDDYPQTSFLGTFLGEVEVENAEMFDLGPYPGAYFNLEDNENSVKGVIIELPEDKEHEVIEYLDAYESAPTLYKRVGISVSGYGDAVAYEYAFEPIEEVRPGERKISTWQKYIS